MRSVSLPFVFLPVVLVAACAGPTGPTPINDLTSGDLFDAPWPSDARRDADGTISVAGFPNPNDAPFVDKYLALAEELDGFGTNSAAFFRFRRSLSTEGLPDPVASLSRGSAIALFAIAPGAPYDGERVPVQWHYQDAATTFEPSHLLAVAPVWGFPLRPRTTYGVVISSDIASPSPSFDAPDALIDALPAQGYGLEDVAIGTTFTTQDPTSEMARMARFLRDDVTAPVLDQALVTEADTNGHRTYSGHVPAPLFQHGQRPYALEGGGFAFRDNGTPIIAEWENLTLVVSVPHSTPPAGGWPVVLYQHGTGGDAMGFARGTGRLAIANVLARAGYVGVGIDQPLNGDRATPDTNVDLHTFNYLNPTSARATLRQGALDALWMMKVLSSRQTTFETEHGDVQLDPTRLFLLGHSQGGLTGAIAAPWLGDTTRGAVLSGAGGVLSITILERKEPLDISETLEGLLAFQEGEHLHELHPVVSLVQTLVEVTDPINYAPYWFAEERPWGGSGAPAILDYSGLLDADTPARAGEALAVAGHLQPLAPAFSVSDGHDLLGLPASPGPLTNNGEGANGPVTAAFSQWDGENHFVIFHNSDASAILERFLDTGRSGPPVAERPQ